MKVVHIVLRVLMLGVLALLLVNPYLRHKVKSVEQPTLVLLHDNSASLVLSGDSLFFKEAYPAELETFREALGRDFQVDAYLFGQESRDFDTLSFSDQLTDLSSVMKMVQRRYYKRNVGGVLLFTDGLYNRGFDPSLLAEQSAFPIHTVVLGDTLSHPDLFVQEVHYNKKVSLGSTYPVRVMAGATDCAGQKAWLTVKEDGRVAARQELAVNTNHFSKEFDFMLEAADQGVRQIEIEIGGLDEERQPLNNLKRVFVEVLDQEYKVLCLADAPHPDLGALRSVLGDDCEMDFVFGRESLPELSGYQLLVMHQTPCPRTDMDALLQQLERNPKLPLLLVVGNATDMKALGKLQQSFELRRTAANTLLDAKGQVNPAFATFTLSDKLRDNVGRFPPLAMPYVEAEFSAPHDDLLLQEVLGVKSGQPLMTFVKGERKTALLLGTNLWRWRLFNYYQDKNSAVFDELFSKTLNYLMLSRDDGSAVFAKEEYYGNERIVITAELRNPANELVTEPELDMRIINKMTGDTYDYVFSKREHDYELNAGVLPEGVYTYRATAEVAGQAVTLTGTFAVVALGIEAQRLTADIALLRHLSAATDGQCYTVDQLPRLLDDLHHDARITTVEHHETRFEDLIHSKWLFAVLVALVAIDWLLRKMFGTY